MSRRAPIARLADAWRWLARTARLAVGVPDYAAYVAHVRKAHPGRTPMTPGEFARERMSARYARGRGRCC
ncbi:putative selenoprotein [Lysobacter sp. N42]|nr:CstA-like transporter-associated (seleno)protein [Lysobacter sp. N42]TCZ88630.1 putative selenoprotein [Lysobacter sp. N42]